MHFKTSPEAPQKLPLHLFAVLEPITGESNIIITAEANTMGDCPASPEAYWPPQVHAKAMLSRKEVEQEERGTWHTTLLTS